MHFGWWLYQLCCSFCKKVLVDNTEVWREDQDTLYEKSACIELSGSSVTSLTLVLQSELSAGQISIDSVAVTSKSCPREFSPLLTSLVSVIHTKDIILIVCDWLFCGLTIPAMTLQYSTVQMLRISFIWNFLEILSKATLSAVKNLLKPDVRNEHYVAPNTESLQTLEMKQRTIIASFKISSQSHDLV